jgi:hypothetical protein
MFDLLKTDSQKKECPGRKFKLILLLALGLAGSFSGCSTLSPANKTVILDYANDISPATDEVVITDLGKKFSIHESANSWPALIRKTKPTFAWNDCDLMWIETNQQDGLQFTMDEAYVYQPTNQPLQWVLLDDKTNVPYGDRRLESPAGWNLHAVASLRDGIPPRQYDIGERGNYAAMIGTSPHSGNVYEIGWQRESGAGIGHPDYGRRIYLFQDQASSWHFLGEGPEEASEHGEENTVQSQVEWIGAESNDRPFKIKFHVETIISSVDYTLDETNRPPDEYKTNNYVLAGPFPAKFQELK